MDDRPGSRVYCAMASLAGLKFVGFVLVDGELGIGEASEARASGRRTAAGLNRLTLLRPLVSRTERLKAKALIREAQRLCERGTRRRSRGRPTGGRRVTSLRRKR